MTQHISKAFTTGCFPRHALCFISALSAIGLLAPGDVMAESACIPLFSLSGQTTAMGSMRAEARFCGKKQGQAEIDVMTDHKPMRSLSLTDSKYKSYASQLSSIATQFRKARYLPPVKCRHVMRMSISIEGRTTSLTACEGHAAQKLAEDLQRVARSLYQE